MRIWPSPCPQGESITRPELEVGTASVYGRSGARYVPVRVLCSAGRAKDRTPSGVWGSPEGIMHIVRVRSTGTWSAGGRVSNATSARDSWTHMTKRCVMCSHSGGRGGSHEIRNAWGCLGALCEYPGCRCALAGGMPPWASVRTADEGTRSSRYRGLVSVRGGKRVAACRRTRALMGAARADP